EGLPVMNRTQIREVATEFEIGSHTYDHCFLNSVDFPQAKFQVMKGKEILQDVLGFEVTGFCYPGGKYRREHTDLVQSAGFKYARTTLNLCFDTGSRVFEMPTTCQFYPHRRMVYLRNFSRGGHWFQRRAGLALALRRSDWIDRLYDLFDHACTHEAIFHLWMHSIDIDRLDAWHELDIFFAYVALNVAKKDRLNNAQLAARYSNRL
ncbi:MAG: polysaccharide deacetylase family protein, partial [Pseudomonadota bacterium]